MSCVRVITLPIITASTRISFQKINASSVSLTCVPQAFKLVLTETCVEFWVALLLRKIKKENQQLNKLSRIDKENTKEMLVTLTERGCVFAPIFSRKQY